MSVEEDKQLLEDKQTRGKRDATIRKLEAQVEQLQSELRYTKELLGKAMIDLSKHQEEFNFKY